MPYFDPDTRMIYVAGKGDGNVRYYEVVDEAPWVCFLSQFISGAPQKGFGVLPKRGVNVNACEVFRLYKLHATKVIRKNIKLYLTFQCAGLGGANLNDRPTKVGHFPGRHLP